MNGEYVPSGELQGDSKKLPTNNGAGVTDTYGADLSQSSTNRQGSISRSTKSDSPFKNMPKCPEGC